MGDSQLEDFVRAPIQEGRRVRSIHPVRLVLSAAIVALVATILAPTADELLFHFRKDPPTDIGDAMQLPSGSVLPVGSRIRAHVVFGNRAAEIPLWRPGSLRVGPIMVRQVLGAPLWVEYTKKTEPSWGIFVETDVEGRVVSFDGELAEVRKVVEQQGIEIPPDARVIIVDDVPGRMTSYVVAWTLGLSLVLWTLLTLLRASRPRVVRGDVLL